MSDKMSERIRSLREKANLKQTELADLLGVADGTISKWERGILKPGRDKVGAMAQIFSSTADYILGNVDDPKTLIPATPLSPEVLLTRFADEADLEIWDIYNASKEILEKDDPEGYEEEFKNISENFISVPVVEPIACAGTGNAYVDIQFDVVEERCINKSEVMGHSWHSAGFKIIKIEGDSMEPRFLTGDMVLLSEEEARSGDIIVACWDYRFYLRGFFVEDNIVRLRAINQKYQDIEIDFGDERFSVVGKVVAVVPPLKKIGGYW